MILHLLAATMMIGLVTTGGLAAIRYLFPQTVRSVQQRPSSQRLRTWLKLLTRP